jgi:hypothetical protein
MFYNLIRFIVVNFGIKFENADGTWGYQYRALRILFPRIGSYEFSEVLTIGKHQVKYHPRRRRMPIWNKPALKKYYKAIRELAHKVDFNYEWDEMGDYQIIPNGFVMYHTDSEFLFQESVRIGFNIPTKRNWRSLDNPIFIGLRFRYGTDW